MGMSKLQDAHCIHKPRDIEYSTNNNVHAIFE
jgi:hypothetical protein